jgi:hypothetical protein
VARLVELVGRRHAEALLVEAARLDATRALEAGLAHAITDDEPLRAAAELELARLRTAQRRGPRGARAVLADLAGAARLRLRRADPARPELERATALAAELVQRTARGHDVRALEIDALAELALSGAARRLAAHHRHAHAPLPEAAKQEAEAMHTAMVLEALALVDAGASAADVDRAARLFGFASPPLASLEHTGRDVLALRVERLRRARGDRFDDATATRTVRPRRHVLEELQQRMALRFVNEAFFAREAGVADEIALDLAAVRHGGFPAFRGGPFEYVETIGAGEIATRLAHLAREVHPRFSAAPGLAAWTREAAAR